jgi:antitoxin YefM
MAESLNAVNDNSELLVVSRAKGKNVVVMSLEAYNSIQETIYLNQSATNRNRLEEAIQEMKVGNFIQQGINEE